MAELGLFPEPKILILQGVVFLAALASANHFIISPALRLYNERKKRTSGAVVGAKNLEAKSEAMEKAYADELAARTVEAKELRLSEVLAGQAEADSIINQSIAESRTILQEVERSLESAVKEERAKLPLLAKDISKAMVEKLGIVVALTFAVSPFLALVSSNVAIGAGGGHVDPMEGIFWPLFQFACFLGAVIYFGRKTMASLLEKRRDTLRTQLSEAKQAVVLAERKAKEFENKLANLSKEVVELRNQYVNDGVRERSKLLAEAKILAQNMVRDAQRAANELVAKSREQLRRELVEMAAGAVQQELTADRLTRLDESLRREAFGQLSSLSSGKR
jgi:F0F1-type ATP synthase membrane subunit b/b'